MCLLESRPEELCSVWRDSIVLKQVTAAEKSVDLKIMCAIHDRKKRVSKRLTAPSSRGCSRPSEGDVQVQVREECESQAAAHAPQQAPAFMGL